MYRDKIIINVIMHFGKGARKKSVLSDAESSSADSFSVASNKGILVLVYRHLYTLFILFVIHDA